MINNLHESFILMYNNADTFNKIFIDLIVFVLLYNGIHFLIYDIRKIYNKIFKGKDNG